MGKTLGEMTPAERQAAIKRAADAMQRELTANAPAIGAVMDGWSWDAGLQRWTAELDGRMIVWRSGADAPPSMTPAEAAAKHEAWHGRGHGAPARLSCAECGGPADGSETALDEMTGREVPVCDECAPMLRLATPEQIAAELDGPECTCPVNRSLQTEHSRGCAAAPSGSF